MKTVVVVGTHQCSSVHVMESRVWQIIRISIRKIRGETTNQRKGRMKENSSGNLWFHIIWDLSLRSWTGTKETIQQWSQPIKPFSRNKSLGKQKHKTTQFATLLHKFKLGLDCFFLFRTSRRPQKILEFSFHLPVFLLLQHLFPVRNTMFHDETTDNYELIMLSCVWNTSGPKQPLCYLLGLDWTCVFTVILTTSQNDS